MAWLNAAVAGDTAERNCRRFSKAHSASTALVIGLSGRPRGAKWGGWGWAALAASLKEWDEPMELGPNERVGLKSGQHPFANVPALGHQVRGEGS